MSSTSLHSKIATLARTFADDVLAAVRTASLAELVGDGGTGRGRGATARETAREPAAAPAVVKDGRLGRRTPEDIAKTLGLVVAALKGSRGKGMRAEEIRTFLNLDRRELPRVLEEGLRTKALRKTGQKRATVYTAR